MFTYLLESMIIIHRTDPKLPPLGRSPLENVPGHRVRQPVYALSSRIGPCMVSGAIRGGIDRLIQGAGEWG